MCNETKKNSPSLSDSMAAMPVKSVLPVVIFRYEAQIIHVTDVPHKPIVPVMEVRSARHVTKAPILFFQMHLIALNARKSFTVR